MNRIATLTLIAIVSLNLSSCHHGRNPLRRLLGGHPKAKLVGRSRAPVSDAADSGVAAQPTPVEPTDLSIAEMDWYPWIKNSKDPRPRAVTVLRQRFGDPAGYQRIVVNPGTIGEWLRFLPLGPGGTSVTDSVGRTALVTAAGFAAAVVAIDMHAEESADALLRLHAEWRFGKGDRATITYASNSGRPIPFGRWISGERIVAKKGSWDFAYRVSPIANPSYADLRSFLDAAYPWTDPRALAIQGKVLDATDVAPGDYFVHAGKDPTLVIVLDVATNAAGEPAMLFGHVAAPHQNMYVMRATKDSPWFIPKPNREIPVPGLKPFLWKEHHRLPQAMIGRPI